MSKLILIQLNNKNIELLKEGDFIYKRIFLQAFISTISLGLILLILNKELLESGFWIYIKFLFVSLIIILHYLC